MEPAVRSIVDQGNQLFGKRGQLHSLWQTTAENFYPERADFTVQRSLGDELASNLYSSYPILARRDLGNSLSSMLRRDNWFNIRTDSGEEKTAGLQWLDRATEVQRNLMYARGSGFVRSTKEGDHDFAAFGQAALSVELNKQRSGLLYRCWHLKDVAWTDDDAGETQCIHRNWKPSAVNLKSVFKDKVSPKLQKIIDKNPNAQIKCRHIVVPAEMYNGLEDVGTSPYVSIHIDVQHDHVMEITGLRNKMYIIPRWQTVSGSQYAYSPATVAALPDGRLLQAMTMTLLEAGQKFTNPPMLAVQDALRSDIDIVEGGITWIDAKYDERLGEVLRPLTQNLSGMPLGLEMQADVRAQIADAFFLTKLNLPLEGDMTAFEVSKRMDEFVRHTLPLFEPMETEYNGQLCEMTFDLLMDVGAFGSPYDIPEELRGQKEKFKFNSPIQEAADRDKGQKFLEMKGLLREAMEIDPLSVAHINIDDSFHDALTGTGIPADWLYDEKEVAQGKEQLQQQKMASQVANAALEGKIQPPAQ